MSKEQMKAHLEAFADGITTEEANEALVDLVKEAAGEPEVEQPIETPVEETPVNEEQPNAGEEQPAPVETPVEEVPVETPVESPVEEIPAEQPAEEVPVEETPVEAPVEEIPVEAPIEEVPVVEQPVETPVEEVPVVEVPVEQPGTGEETSSEIPAKVASLEEKVDALYRKELGNSASFEKFMGEYAKADSGETA